MRIIETTAYKFSELSDEAKAKAISNLSDIDTSYEWWRFTYDNAEMIGLKITEFDIDRGYAKGRFTEYAYDVAQNIIRDHGAHCDTVKTAMGYLAELETVSKANAIENQNKGNPEDYLDTEEIDDEFLKSILNDYRAMLQNEFDYLTSEAAIVEAIEANDYEFTIDGKLI